jgi:hypothetical protein
MKRALLTVAFALFAVVIALSGCAEITPTPVSSEPAPVGTEPTPIAGSTSGAFTTDAFSIDYPAGWSAGPCPGSSMLVGHDRDLGAEAQACLSTAGGASCVVFFKDARDSTDLAAAYDKIYRDGIENRAWRIDNEQTISVSGRPAREIVFMKPHGEPYYAMRDVWVPVADGAYIVTCLTYASSYRTVNGQQVSLEELYAPVFDGVIQSFHIKEQAPPTATVEGAPPPTPAEIVEGMPAGPACRFSTSGSGPIAGWYWLRDKAYRNAAIWECTGLPGGAPLPITLTALVTNGADGGSGYSAPVRVSAWNPAGGPDWTAQVYLQNPEPTQNPTNSQGAGYPTTGYFVLPAEYVGADGALRLQLERLAPDPNHVAVNAESLHFDAPQPARAFKAEGPVIAGWNWLRDPDYADAGEWRVSGLQPGLPAVLALDLLATDGADGGAGYSAPVEVTISQPAADVASQMRVIRAQNLLFEETPGNSGGRGYQAYGSLAIDPVLVDAGGELVIQLTRALGTDRHVAVNANSVRVVQLGTPAGGSGGGATATPSAPQDQASCEAQGGRWGRIGRSPREQCNLPASDAGKQCLSSSECEGLCLADISSDQLDAVMRGKNVVHTSGKCSAWRIVVGCVPMVEDGVIRPICID